MTFTEPRFILIRGPYLEKATMGRLLVIANAELLFHCATIERPWLDNQRKASAFPTGTYDIIKNMSPRFQTELWRIVDVPGRSGILIHAGNYAHQLEGCVAVGQRHVDINGDGIPDVTNSRQTLEKLHSIMGDLKKTTIEVIGYSGQG